MAGFPEGHPGTPNRLKEMDYLKQKVDAGADYICTQLFFDNRDFYDFRERCDLAGIKVPIVAGSHADRVALGHGADGGAGAGGAVPGEAAARARPLRRRRGRGPRRRHWATEQCLDLLNNQVRGIHFYTLNRSDATRRIYENLGVTDSAALRAG